MITTVTKPEWINATHMHCRKCGEEIECWKEVYWRVDYGVCRIGGCIRCGQILVQYEYRPPLWIEWIEATI